MVSARSPMAGDSLGVDEAAGGLLSLGMPGEVVVEGAGVACAGVGDGRATEIDGVATGALGAGVAQPARLARTPSSSRRLACRAVCIRSPDHDVVVMEDELPHVAVYAALNRRRAGRSGTSGSRTGAPRRRCGSKRSSSNPDKADTVSPREATRTASARKMTTRITPPMPKRSALPTPRRPPSP